MIKLPMKDVAGKVAFIAGGSSGIGLGMVRAFLDSGMKVALGYWTQENLDEAMNGLADASERVHAIRVNVTDRRGMEEAAAETIKVFGKVHVLVNNAGVAVDVPLSKTTYDDWDWVIGVNLNGVFNGIHAFLPRIQAHGEGGQVVATSSNLGLFVGAGLGGSYAASKFAVVGLMEALRTELADTNIGVSVFCPGLVNSNFVNSDRSRPSRLAQNGSESHSVSTAQRRESLKHLIAAGMDPLEAGRLVLRGIRNNDLYILTHPEFEQGIRERTEALIASIPSDLHPPATRVAVEREALSNSIYTMERDRKRGTLAKGNP